MLLSSRLRQKQMEALQTCSAHQAPRRFRSPAMLDSGLYRKALLKPKATMWRAKHSDLHLQESRSTLIKRKLEELWSKSTLEDPWCLKCGSWGYMIRHCRNAQQCFVNNKFGNKGKFCSAIMSIPPVSPPNRRSDFARDLSLDLYFMSLNLYFLSLQWSTKPRSFNWRQLRDLKRLRRSFCRALC